MEHPNLSGDLDENTLISIFNLARLHLRTRNPALALPLMEECLRGFRHTTGAEHEQTLKAMAQSKSKSKFTVYFIHVHVPFTSET